MACTISILRTLDLRQALSASCPLRACKHRWRSIAQQATKVACRMLHVSTEPPVLLTMAITKLFQRRTNIWDQPFKGLNDNVPETSPSRVTRTGRTSFTETRWRNREEAKPTTAALPLPEFTLVTRSNVCLPRTKAPP